MSRRKAEKSNIPRIGIFTDKSATYNLKILEILDKLNHATAWQIAKKIAEGQKPIANMDMETQSRRIYSVIQRENGRLNDLANKGYIRESERLWELTIRGGIALAIKNPAVLAELEAKDRSRAYDQVTQSINAMPETVLNAPFGITVNRSETKKDLLKTLSSLKNNPSLYRMFIEETKDICQKIDLDGIDEFTLLSMIVNRSQFQTAIKKLLNDISKMP
jgi:hypothetical protein